ncbi:MAG: SagB/ThcOx family dehydrogenase [Anaerolineae bacterium]|nr:SagB/ThcOx family dehydrogenase [Anaerolineae bacterium]
MREITLPSPNLDGSVSLEAAIAARRSVRSYGPEELSLDEISQLLWSAQGVTGARPDRRAAPSAGALHPLELFVCRSDGVWHYRPQGHRLIKHIDEDVREALAQAAWKQTFLGKASVVFLMSAVIDRTTGKYQERGRVRYVPMDAGHAAENMLLQAVVLGLGGVPVGAFQDAEVARVAHLPSDQDPLYLIPVGKLRGGE